MSVYLNTCGVVSVTLIFVSVVRVHVCVCVCVQWETTAIKCRMTALSWISIAMTKLTMITFACFRGVDEAANLMEQHDADLVVSEHCP